jgi:transposase
MSEFVVTDEDLAFFWDAVSAHLDERQLRITAGAMVRALDRHGAAKAVAAASGLSAKTVQKGTRELDEGIEPSAGVRSPGAGRKMVEESQPGLVEALDQLIDPETRGDPMCPLRWTTKSTRVLADELTAQGYPVSHSTLAKVLNGMGYSLQAPAKTREGADHPDRDAQFRYLDQQVRAHMAAGEPVISVDGKKKENVGNYAPSGREWQPMGEPVEVNMHDFPDKELGKVTPYGVYDIFGNNGWVTVGTSADTAEFATSAIRRWWEEMGQAAYPGASRLLITADGGGSNGHRSRLWKREIVAFAKDTGLEITVCHYPPGTSKWNKIEHRMFSHITRNWRGRPLESHEVVVNLIANTTTRTGLKIRTELDQRTYVKGIEVSKKEVKALPIEYHEFHGNWNYTVKTESANAQ